MKAGVCFAERKEMEKVRFFKKAMPGIILFLLVCAASFSLSFRCFAGTDTVRVFVKGECDRQSALASVAAVNNERAKEGKNLLSADKSLFEAAEQRAAEIALSFSHVRTDGSAFFSVFETRGKTYGENIAFGALTGEQAAQFWLSLPGDRANACSSSYSRVGAACFRTADGAIWWVHLFDSLEAGCGPETENAEKRLEVRIPAEKLKLSVEPEKTEMAADQKNMLKIFTLNEGAPGQKTLLETECFSFSLSPDIAGVQNGYIVPHGRGRTVLSMKHEESDAASAECVVKITGCMKHTPKTEKAVLPTCTKKGLTEGKSCVRCKSVIREQKVVAATGHSFSKPVVSKKATYSSAGVRTYTCCVCKARLNEAIAVLPLSKPQGLKASDNTPTSLTLSWKKVKGAKKYEVYIKKSSGSWTKRSETQKTTLKVTKLGAGEVCYFKLKAVCESNKSTFSEVLKTAAAPASPQVKAKSEKAGQLTVSWKGVRGADGYIVYYSSDRSFKNGVKKKTVRDSVKKLTLKSLEEGKNCYIKVRAYKTVNGKKLLSPGTAAVRVQIMKKPLQKAQTVYVTRTGTKFHRSGCSSLEKSKRALSRSAAVKQGYKPCLRCKP